MQDVYERNSEAEFAHHVFSTIQARTHPLRVAFDADGTAELDPVVRAGASSSQSASVQVHERQIPSRGTSGLSPGFNGNPRGKFGPISVHLSQGWTDSLDKAVFEGHRRVAVQPPQYVLSEHEGSNSLSPS